MTGRERPRIAIFGGGMAGLTAAWRLSEPGWQDRFESITVYQRGHRLGGKGASSRGEHGRVEEHGLHVWLGYYDNAFRVLRECYAEVDRPTTDPACPIRTWDDALHPSNELGLEDRHGDQWRHWLGTFTANDLVPGEPFEPAEPVTLLDLIRQALVLVVDFLESMPSLWDEPGAVRLSTSPRPPRVADPVQQAIRVGLVAGLLDALVQLERPDGGGVEAVEALDRVLELLRERLGPMVEEDADARRMWLALSMMTATTRGVVADGLATDPMGFERVNEEDLLDWLLRHGADPGLADFAFIRGLYELVFAPVDEQRRSTRGVAAGVAVTVTLRLFFQYRGSLFWKMNAGMGDIVFAPLHQALVARGVHVEYFHRLDQLHLSGDGTLVDAITVGQQVELAAGIERYEPLVRVKGLPCFPLEPDAEQLADPAAAHEDLESHFCTWPDARTRVLRRGEDFDITVLAVPIDMARLVSQELTVTNPRWSRMLERVETTATIALQLWLRPEEPALGWSLPGITVSGYEPPFATWASMPQLIAVEDWPAADRPGTIAYFCGASSAPWPPDRPPAEFVEHQEQGTTATALEFIERHLPHFLPGASRPDGSFRWDLLCNRNGATGPEALSTQFTSTNIDPSDRYVLCVPGSDRFRLRSDESGVDNLFLAGDWTDNGVNAGCIEAAVLSGLQAANAILGRPRFHRISGGYGR